MTEKWIVLDRDGVINHDSDEFIKSPAEFVPIPGSLEAIARLNRAGYKVAVATNQSGVARGLYDLATLEAIHARLTTLLAGVGGELAGIFYCPHGPEDGCDCRKPKPGLMHQIAKAFGIDLNGVPVVGDSLRDLVAGRAVGCVPYLVCTGKGKRTIAKGEGLEGVAIFDDLAAMVDTLLAS